MVSAVRVAPSAATRALNLLRTVTYTHPPSCPCHGNPAHHHHHKLSSGLVAQTKRNLQRNYATPIDTTRQKEYAFEMAASSIRYGPGVTKEVGMDFKNMGAKRVCVVTDKTVRELNAMKQVEEGLTREGIEYTVYDGCRVEPKDSSIKDAIAFAKPYQPDAFLAVGGGSVIDTAKLMNLYTCFPNADFLDFVNAPLGKGLPIDKPLKPLIAVPTTAGTGSETTGTAIFDLVSKRAKTGIAHRNLKPTLGICDPLNTRTMPSAVHASSGLDVLCHSLESWTAIPYFERIPRPSNPILRPAYQGANPISDIFSLQALRSTVKYLPRAVKDPEDHEAQSQMLLAATLAGVGFGNAGVHLCHGMSYPISGQNPGYKHAGYAVDAPIIPHGVSVAVSAPAVFRFTGPSNPERHLQAAEAFGVDVSNVKKENAGEVLGEALQKFLADLGDQPKGLKDLGFKREHLDDLVEGTIPQARVLMLAPGLAEEITVPTSSHWRSELLVSAPKDRSTSSPASMSSSASMSLVKGPAPQVERTSEEGSKARRLSQTFRGLQTPSISDIMYVRVMMPFKRSRVADLVRYFSKDGANKEETFDIVQLEDYEVKTADNYPLLPVIVRLSLCPVHNNCIICKDVSDDSNVQHITPTAVPASLSILKTHIPSDNAVTSYPPRLSSLKSPYSLEIPPYMYKGTVLIPRHDSGYETIYEDPDEDASATKSEFDINFDDAEIIMKKDCGNQAADDDVEVINQYDLLNDMEEDEDSDDSDGGVKLTGEFADPYAENVLVEKPDINKPLPPSPSFGTSTPESNEPFPSYDEELALEDSYAQQAFDAQVQKTLAEVSIESGLLFIFGQKN